ncbi:DUF3397 domain-containing protein [Neobacillus sp. LXY-4]|uniref:DUF3397 domain-containing protein n=1 Tax=Neobacillus sp. LXY-4 TaxID=3379826 RepID=UPI003EE22F73
MSGFISHVIAAFVTIPILGYLCVFFISKPLLKNHRKAVHLAIDFSTVLFVLAVHHLILVIWEVSYLWLIFLLMIIVALIFVIIHWKTKHEIVFLPIIKGFWRMNFLIFFTTYLVLLVVGLIQRLSSL